MNFLKKNFRTILEQFLPNMQLNAFSVYVFTELSFEMT